MNRAELKFLAKEQIKGNIGILFVISLIIALINGVAGATGLGSLLSIFLLAPAFTMAVTKIYLRLVKGTKPELADLFAEFSNFWPMFKVTFLTGLYTFLWSLLFIIPGYIKALSYSQARFVIAENPDITATEAIERSKEMMEGHKMELFVLQLSFFGWYILVALTLGLAGIYADPYINATLVNFYNKIKPVEAAVQTPQDPIAIEE